MKKNISRIENDFRRYICKYSYLEGMGLSILWSYFCKETKRQFVKADVRKMHVSKHKQDMILRMRKRENEQQQSTKYKVSVQKQLDNVSILLPSSGYSMGEKKRASCTHTENVGVFDTTYCYRGRFRGSETYGSVYVTLKPSELNGYKNIEGVWTKILRRQKNGIHRCETITFQWKTPRKHNNGEVEKVHEFGYLAEYKFRYIEVTSYYHAPTKEHAKKWLSDAKSRDNEGIKRQKKYERDKANKVKALSSWRKSNRKFISDLLKKKYTFDDSLKSGNCEVGTLSFCHRHHFQKDVVLSGKQLIRFAKLDEDLAGHIKIIILRNSGLDSYTTDYDNLQIILDAMVDKVKL